MSSRTLQERDRANISRGLYLVLGNWAWQAAIFILRNSTVSADRNGVAATLASYTCAHTQTSAHKEAHTLILYTPKFARTHTNILKQHVFVFAYIFSHKEAQRGVCKQQLLHTENF